jgi:LysR family hca operon transcriptional activator
VVEEGGLTGAAERRLHTSQPSLSRQIRDLEHEVGVPLLTRTAHGVDPMPAGIVRRQPRPELAYRLLGREPIVVILPSDHVLATHSEIEVTDLKNDPFIGFFDVPHILRAIVTGYLERSGTPMTPTQVIDNFATGSSLVASTRCFAQLPAYAANDLPWSVISRPPRGEAPTMDVVLG